MNLNFSWFLTLPGILISSGVVLLILALILLFVKGKKFKKEKAEMDVNGTATQNVVAVQDPNAVMNGVAVQPVATVGVNDGVAQGSIGMPDATLQGARTMPAVNDVAVQPVMDVPVVDPTVAQPVAVDTTASVPLTNDVAVQPVVDSNVVQPVDINNNIQPVTDVSVNNVDSIAMNNVSTVSTPVPDAQPVGMAMPQETTIASTPDVGVSPVTYASVMNQPSTEPFAAPVMPEVPVIPDVAVNPTVEVLGNPVQPAPIQPAPLESVAPVATVDNSVSPVTPADNGSVSNGPVIYGGANPTATVGNVMVNDNQSHQIYGGADPLENTQPVPQVAPVQPVAPVAPPVMESPVNIPQVSPVTTGPSVAPVQPTVGVVPPQQ